ncbi:MAG: hypothetical protein WCJ93_02375 [Methanomicrobiales archaeon]
MRSSTTDPLRITQEGISSYSRRVLAVVLGITLLTGSLLSTGCTTPGKDPVSGTWEWSDGKGYTERYTFNADHSFNAKALGSEFNGTWETVSSGHYLVTYRNQNDMGQNETLTEGLLYDSSTDAIYFPAHYRVV